MNSHLSPAPQRPFAQQDCPPGFQLAAAGAACYKSAHVLPFQLPAQRIMNVTDFIAKWRKVDLI